MRDGVMIHAATGILGGAAGTALLQRAMKASERLPVRLQPTRARQDPGEFMIAKVEQLRGAPLSRGVRDFAVQGLHWGYGMTAGLLLGLATSRRHVRTAPSALLAGAILGTGVWAVGYAGWLPATKLTPPLTRQGGRHIAASLLEHVAFGLVAAVPLLLMDRRMKEPLWRRALRQISR